MTQQTPTLTTAEAFEPIFDELWLALGPKDRDEYPGRCRAYHKALRDLHAVSIRAAVERAVQRSRLRMLPAPGELRALGLEHAAELKAALDTRANRDLPPVPNTHCSCRCGGRRWYEVLRDPVTKAVRTYPAEISELAVPIPSAAPDGAFARAVRKLAGEPMLRQHLTCKRHPGAPVDREPSHGYIGLHEDGCPVFDPHAPAGRAQEAA